MTSGPLALLSGVYKLLAKVLALRLTPFMDSLISELQGASVEGRQIQDIGLIANELLASRKRSKIPGTSNISQRCLPTMALEVLSIVITPVTELGKYLVRELRYVTEYNSYFSKFHNELLQLKARREDVQMKVENARRDLQEPLKEVSGWVEAVEELEKKCMPLTTNNSTDNKCLMGRLCSRRRISKKILKLTRDICELKEEGSFNVVAHQRSPPAVVPMDSMGTVENIPSRERIMKQVMEALEDDNIRSIGVHGMGGIGKTTLVSSINNKLAGNSHFKKVIMVTVSKNPDVKIIQHKIAERLGLTLGEQDVATRADKLCERLRDEGRVLIILDDVWEVMELGDIGFRHSIEHMPCKLIVTTRNANVCSRMKVQEKIEMVMLHEDEAWTLFEAKAGNVLVKMPSLVPTAREIVQRCKGSPLAISVLGSTLGTAEEEAASWAEHALRVLKEPNAVCLEGIMPAVVESLRWSYDHLKNNNVQQCFLYCCLFPEDYNIRLTDLRNYGIGEGFLTMTSSLKEAHNELRSYVKILKDCCLLLDGEYESSVRMHDVVRDVGICIASNKEDGFLVNVGGGSKYLPESDKLHTYKRISFMINVFPDKFSFMNNYDSVFPDALECPQLRSLLVRESNLETNYSFEGVKSLLVLHMAHYSFERVKSLASSRIGAEWKPLSVPKSISQLRNLRTLYLDGCDLLDKTYLLGGLTKLQVLSMRFSVIGELPEDFANLTNLKFLDLTDARIHFVAPNVFSKFSKMEELLIADSIKGWGTTGELKDDIDDGSRRHAELKEVLSLPRLSLLNIRIARPLSDGEVLTSHNLQHFRISADKYIEGYFRSDYYLNNLLHIGSTDLGKHGIRNLIDVSKKNLDLCLQYCGGFKSVTDLNPAGSFNHLQYLMLDMCNDVESVIVADRSTITAQDSFEKLERLELHRMDKMERILHGATSSPKFFGKLKVLFVWHCSKICTIFPSNLLFTENRLENLKRVTVEKCDEVQHIVNTEDNEFGATLATTAFLSGVTDISLCKLPKLKSIWKGIMPEGSFQRLTELYIERCHSLKSIFSFCVAGHLHKLNKLSISHCHGLRQVLGNGDEPRVTEHRCLLPELKYLQLVDLMSLTRFDPDHLPITAPLEEIKVFVCPNLRKLPLQTVSALKFIHAEDIWFRNLELEDEIQASILKPFFQPFFPPYFPVTRLHRMWHMGEKLHSLMWKVAGLWLDDYDSQLEGTTQFRRLLFRGCLDDMPIRDVRKSGVVPCLVEFLARDDHTQLQSEAAWVLANIAFRSSYYTKLVIDHVTLPIFVKLLCSPNEDIKQHDIWGHGNIASHSPEDRDLALQHGGLIPLLAQLNDSDSVSILSNALRTMYNIFAAKTQTPFKQMKLALPAFQHLLSSNDGEVCRNACRALSCFLDVPLLAVASYEIGAVTEAGVIIEYVTEAGVMIEAVTEGGVFTQLMDLLTHPSPLVLSSALHAVNKIVSRDYRQTPCHSHRHALFCLLNLLTHHDVSIKKVACRIISNITSRSEEWIQLVIEAKIIAPVVQLLETAGSGIKEEAARAISYATCRGSQDQIKHLVEQGCIKPFCDLLHCSDSSIVVLCMKGLSNILKVGETGGLGVLNRYVEVIDDSGGFKNIADHLRGHDNVKIQKTALILQKYHDEYRVSQGNAAEASFQSGNSESQCVEKEFLRSTELESPASDSAKSKKPGAIHLKRRRIRHITNKQAKLCRVASRTKQNAGTKSSVYGRVALDDKLHTVSLANAKENNAEHHENDGNTFKEVPNKEHILTSAQLRRKLNAEHLQGESSGQPPKE